MILLTHILAGAVIGSYTKPLFFAILLSLAGHYFLDFIPHNEYPIKNIENNQWQKSFIDFLKVLIDFLIGITIVFIFSKNTLQIYICCFVALIPDGLTMASKFINLKALKKHNLFHHNKVHFLKNKIISMFWRLFFQITIIVILIFLLMLSV